MLDLWATAQPDRRVIEEFWEWLLAKYNQGEKNGLKPLFDIHLEKELDEYQGIDKGQLERERRALLESCRG